MTLLQRRWEGGKKQMKLKWSCRRRESGVEIEPMNECCGERDEKWFEACRCFHILKEIDICVHSDADCTARLQINNHNHKTPQDWLSIELSFFSLWQIWILLLQGSQMTLLSSVLWVCACAFVYLRVEGIQISLSQWTMSIIWSVCVGGNLVTVYRSMLLCEGVCTWLCVCVCAWPWAMNNNRLQ